MYKSGQKTDRYSALLRDFTMSMQFMFWRDAHAAAAKMRAVSSEARRKAMRFVFLQTGRGASCRALAGVKRPPELRDVPACNRFVRCMVPEENKNERGNF